MTFLYLLTKNHTWTRSHFLAFAFAFAFTGTTAFAFAFTVFKNLAFAFAFNAFNAFAFAFENVKFKNSKNMLLFPRLALESVFQRFLYSHFNIC